MLISEYFVSEIFKFLQDFRGSPVHFLSQDSLLVKLQLTELFTQVSIDYILDRGK